MAVKPEHVVGGLAGLAILGGIVYTLTRRVEVLPENIIVSNLVISPPEVYVGESVTISVTATNIGEERATREIILEVPPMIYRTPVTLDPTDSKEVTFTVTPDEARTYEVFVDGLTGSFVALEAPAVDGELVIAFVRWEDVKWRQILETNTWPSNTHIYTAWQVRNTGNVAATFKVRFMGAESDGVQLNPGEEPFFPIEATTPDVGTYDYTLEIIADGEVVATYPITVITTAIEFQVTDLVIDPTEVYVGDPVNISVTVTNVGAVRGTHEVVLEVR